jgi:hypothetical protein
VRHTPITSQALFDYPSITRPLRLRAPRVSPRGCSVAPVGDGSVTGPHLQEGRGARAHPPEARLRQSYAPATGQPRADSGAGADGARRRASSIPAPSGLRQPCSSRASAVHRARHQRRTGQASARVASLTGRLRQGYGGLTGASRAGGRAPSRRLSTRRLPAGLFPGSFQVPANYPGPAGASRVPSSSRSVTGQ